MRKKTRIYYQLLILGAVMSSLLSCYGGKDSDVTDDIQQVTAINGIATDGSYTLYHVGIIVGESSHITLQRHPFGASVRN